MFTKELVSMTNYKITTQRKHVSGRDKRHYMYVDDKLNIKLLICLIN